MFARVILIVWSTITLDICLAEPVTDMSKDLIVMEGDSVRVVLDANPTTGYRWSVKNDHPEWIKLQSQQYIRQSSAVGAGGQRVFEFSLTDMGRQQDHILLMFTYARPWESGQGQTRTLSIRPTHPNLWQQLLRWWQGNLR